MTKNMTVTVAFANSQVRVWGYDLTFFENEEAFLKNVDDDFTDKLKGVLYATVTILKDDDTIDSFTLGSDVKSEDYAEIIASHINGNNSDE